MTKGVPPEFELLLDGSGGLRTRRNVGIKKALQEYAARPIEFAFNPKGTPLYSTEETLRAFAKRYGSIVGAIEALDPTTHPVPAAILSRALIETIGIGSLLVHDINRLIVAGDRQRFDDRVTRYFAGIGGKEVRPVHVMDGIRHLTEVDHQYLAYLNDKWALMGVMFKKFNPDAKDEVDALNKAKEALSLSAHYDLLSEIAHPNGLGTQYLFPDGDQDAHGAGKFREHLIRSCKMAVWYGHHLLSALESADGFTDRYYEKFLEAPEARG